MANESRLSNFDKERGDVSVIPRNLLQTIFDLGSECAFPVLWEYFGWFLGGPDKKMQDPRDNGYLEILKNNQKRQAGSIYERLVRQREKAKARWGGEGDGASEGMPQDAVAYRGSAMAPINENEREREENPRKDSLRSRRETAPSRCDAGSVASGARLQFPSLRYRQMLEDAQKHPESSPLTLQELEDLSTDPETMILEYAGEERSAISRNTIRKYLRTLGKGTVVDVFLKSVQRGDRASEACKVLFRRLKCMADTNVKP